MTHTLDEAGALECLAATPHGSLCPQKSSTGFCNCDHRLRAMLAFAASQAEPKAVGEDAVERVVAVDAFEIGFWFGQSLVGQTMEDSRAVGRLLYADILYPIRSGIEAELEKNGFNSFQSAGSGIVACKRIIRAAIAAMSSSPDTPL